MAQCVRFICGNCSISFDAWSDGNPYFINEDGEKQYAYHPNRDQLERCVGNDVPHLCLTCAQEFSVGSRGDDAYCPHCGSIDIVDMNDLEKHLCPKCKEGVFEVDPDFFVIS